MKLRELRLKENLTQEVLVNKLKVHDCKNIDNLDASLYSKIENGYVLPIPELLRTLCRFYGVEVLDIYEKKEIDLKNANGRKLTKRSQKGKNFCVMLDRQEYSWLKPETFVKAGYANAKEWLEEKLEELKKIVTVKGYAEVRNDSVLALINSYAASMFNHLKEGK